MLRGGGFLQNEATKFFVIRAIRNETRCDI